jgi:hypothetical protein
LHRESTSSLSAASKPRSVRTLPKKFLVSLIVSDTKWIPVGNVKVRFRYPIPVVLDTSWIPRNPYPIPIGIQLVADTSMFGIR